MVDEKKQSSQKQKYTQYIDWIQSLQSLEKEKLQLTAAIHLEKIRVSNQQSELQQQGKKQKQQKGDDEMTEGDTRVLDLLEQGVTNLQQKIDKCVADINILLDDLRCALVEEIEEEEDEEE